MIVVRRKSDSSGNQLFRVVIDFRTLNEKTVGYAYPQANMSNILEQLCKLKLFRTVDLVNGFSKIWGVPEHRAKTDFIMPLGHYEFLLMRCELKGAPSSVQRLINCVLSGS